MSENEKSARAIEGSAAQRVSEAEHYAQRAARLNDELRATRVRAGMPPEPLADRPVRVQCHGAMHNPYNPEEK